MSTPRPSLSFPADTMHFDLRDGGMYFSEFTIAMGGDVDMRCACRFMEFHDGDAVFAWVEGCPIHPKMPRRPLSLEVQG